VLVKSPVFDRDDRLGQMWRKVLRGQPVALEYAARRKGLAFGALDGYRALRRLDLQTAGDRQRGNAVQDQSDQQHRGKRQRCDKVLCARF